MRGFLEGILSEAANYVSGEREQARKDEERSIETKRGYLDYLMKGMQEGTVRPEYFAQAWQDAHTLAGGRGKSKKGKAGFMGQTESPELPFFQAVTSGQIPLMPETKPPMSEVPPQGAAGPQMSMMPKMPGTGNLMEASTALASARDQVPEQPLPTGRPSLFYGPGEQKTAGLTSAFETLRGFGASDDQALHTIQAMLGDNQSMGMKYGGNFVAPDGKTLAKAAWNPASQTTVLLQPMLYNGQLYPAGVPLPPGFQPAEGVGVAFDTGGTATGYNKRSGTQLWHGGVQGRATPDLGNAMLVPDEGSPTGARVYQPSRFSGGRGAYGPAGIEQPPIQVDDPDAVEAERQMKLAENEVERNLTAASFTKANEEIDRVLQQKFGRTLTEVQQVAGRAPRTLRPRKTGPAATGASRSQPNAVNVNQTGDEIARSAIAAYLKTPEGRQSLQQAKVDEATGAANLMKDPQQVDQIVRWFTTTKH